MGWLIVWAVLAVLGWLFIRGGTRRFLDDYADELDERYET